MSTAVKLLIGVGAIGGVVGGSLVLNRYLSNDDIQSKLRENNLEILRDNDERWEKILASYKKVSVTEAKFKFSGKNIENKEQLQARCKETFKKSTSEDNSVNNYFQKAKRWCTVPDIVSKILRGKSRTILDTNNGDDKANETEWNEKIKAYTAQNNEDKIKDLDLGNNPIISDFNKDKRDKIKDACRKLNEKESYEDGYEEALKKSETWCTIEKKEE